MTTLPIDPGETAAGDARRAAPRWLLPREAYTSQEWFDREMEQLFERCWSFAGMTDDIPLPGDYSCVSVGRQPVVVVRSARGELQAFHNLCRHRGAQLLEGRGNVKRGISCFYHRWRYDLDGSLEHVPQADQFPDLCQADLGLKPAAVGEWNGLVFVHPDPDPAQDLLSWLAGFPEAMGPFRPAELNEVKVERHELSANWKFFLENHVDGYHLWHLHAKSIKGLAHAQQDWAPTGRHWTLYEPPSTAGAYADRDMTGLPLIPTIPAGGYGSSVQLVFPNLALAGGSTFWATVLAIPVAPDRTIVEIRTRIAPMARAEQTRALAGFGWREAVRRAAKSPAGPALKRLHLITAAAAEDPDFVKEDLYAAESLQRAVQSRRFEVGPMAEDYENAITFFQQNILDYLAAGQTRDAPPVVP